MRQVKRVAETAHPTEKPLDRRQPFFGKTEHKNAQACVADQRGDIVENLADGPKFHDHQDHYGRKNEADGEINPEIWQGPKAGF